MKKSLLIFLVFVGLSFLYLSGRDDSQTFAYVTDVDPKSYSGQTFTVIGTDGLSYSLPVYRDAAGQLRSNNFSWYNDGSYHQGYVCCEQGRVVIVECDEFSDALCDGAVNPSSFVSSDKSVRSVKQTDTHKPDSSRMSLQALDHERSRFVAQQKSNYAQMQYAYRVELMSMLSDCSVGLYHGKAIRVWNRDRPLFQAICDDNKSIDPVVLCGMLACDPRFNYLHYFCCDTQKIEIPDLSPDIVINLDHFNKVDNAVHRQALYHELTQLAADRKVEQQHKQQKIDARKTDRACQKNYANEQSALLKAQKKEQDALARNHLQEQAAAVGDKNQQARLRVLHERQDRELFIKHANEKTLLDAQQYQQRPTVRGWLHEKISKFVYGCTSSAENKTAKVLQQEVREKAQRKAASERAVDQQRCKKAKNNLSLQDVTTSFGDFIRTDTLSGVHELVQTLYHNYQDKVTHSVSHHAHEYFDVMERRVQALQQSYEQPVVTTHNFSCDAQTAGCMQAYGVDVQNFAKVQGLPMCHQITQELVDIFTGISRLNQQQLAQSRDLIQLCSDFVQVAQQDNLDDNFVQALQSANCSHGLFHYIQGCYRSGIDKIQQMMTASAYLNDVIDSYGFDCAVAAAQGYFGATALEAVVTAGLACAPVVTTGVVACLTGITAMTVAPLCLQAVIDTTCCLGSCITGQWEQVQADLQRFADYVGRRETGKKFAEFVGACGASTENLTNIISNIVSLRPVVTRVVQESGHATQSLYLMTKQQLHNAWQQSVELLQLPEFKNFNRLYQQKLGCRFFDILPQSHPALLPAFQAYGTGLIDSAETTTLTQLLTESGSSQAGKALATAIVNNNTSMNNIGNSAVEQKTFVFDASYLRAVGNLEEQLSKSVGIDLVKVQNLKDMFEPYCRSDIILPGLQEIKGVAQIEYYRDITNNFEKTNMLEPHEIAYLNMCYGLYPYFVKINERVKSLGLCITESDGTKTEITEFDLFHSLFGEMKHVSTANPSKRAMDFATKGGHWLFASSKILTHEAEDVVPLDGGFFDLFIKHINFSGKAKPKTFFPYGMLPDECVNIIIDTIQTIKLPNKAITDLFGKKSFEITNENFGKFALHVENGIARFYPLYNNGF